MWVQEGRGRPWLPAGDLCTDAQGGAPRLPWEKHCYLRYCCMGHMARAWHKAGFALKGARTVAMPLLLLCGKVLAIVTLHSTGVAWIWVPARPLRGSHAARTDAHPVLATLFPRQPSNEMAPCHQQGHRDQGAGHTGPRRGEATVS